MRIGLVGAGRIGAFHAATLTSLPSVDAVVVTDADADAVARVARDQGATPAGDLETLLAAVDAVVIATATPGHAPVLRAAVSAGLPAFCEKPIASTLPDTIALVETCRNAATPVQVGFQRRFDRGYLAARAAVASGDLGRIHAIRAATHDRTPPRPGYLPTSGGLFRDCTIHDIDIVRFVTGREVVSVYATGATTGAAFFADADDIDTGAAILVLTDDTLVTATATRYSGAGHDVRMEVMGEVGSVGVGLDDSLALRSVEPGATFPAGPPHTTFMDRFGPAYRAELAAFVELAAGRGPNRCTVEDALAAARVAEACEISRREHRRVDLTDVADVADHADTAVAHALTNNGA